MISPSWRKPLREAPPFRVCLRQYSKPFCGTLQSPRTSHLYRPESNAFCQPSVCQECTRLLACQLSMLFGSGLSDTIRDIALHPQRFQGVFLGSSPKSEILSGRYFTDDPKLESPLVGCTNQTTTACEPEPEPEPNPTTHISAGAALFEDTPQNTRPIEMS